jgi:AraC-like DNA-binding protein
MDDFTSTAASYAQTANSYAQTARGTADSSTPGISDWTDLMQHVVLKPEIPHQLFVGSVEGLPTCTADSRTYEIWPKLLLMVLMQGVQHFVVDGVPFHIDAGQDEGASPLVFMLNVARRSTLRFIHDHDAPIRKAMISAPRPWLEWLMRTQTQGSTTLNRFLSEHLAQFRYTPCRQVTTLAEQLINPPPSMQGEIRTLYRSSRGLDILSSSWATLLDHRDNREKPGLASLRQSERVRDYIVDNLDDALTIDKIARSIGASVSSVQRHFKEHFGVTVFEFVRSTRLERASEALERDGVSIAQAAHLAGYANPAHFTTAFKRTYGVLPSQRRR